MVLNDLETTITRRIHPIEMEEINKHGRASLCWFSLLPVFFVILLAASWTDARVQPSPSGTAPQAAEHAGSASMEKEEAEHGLSPKPVEVARVFGFPITNSMILSWIVGLGLIMFVQVTTRTMKPIPDGAQNFLEWLVESLYSFLEGLLGRRLVDRTFWFFATIFIF